MWKAALAAILPLALFACAPDEAELHGDIRFSEAERAEIQRGSDWLRAQAGLPAARIAFDTEIEGHGPLRGTIRRERGPGNVSGFCAEPGLRGAVYLDPADGSLAGLAAHELAHCELGFEDRYHADEEKSDGIMRVLDPMLWTEAERRQCVEHADLCPSGRH
jgi:hypothetical protein